MTQISTGALKRWTERIAARLIAVVILSVLIIVGAVVHGRYRDPILEPFLGSLILFTVAYFAVEILGAAVELAWRKFARRRHPGT